MSKHDTSLSPATSTNRTERHDGWTLAKQAAFLRALSATHSVTQAAKSVSMSRQSAYRLRSTLKGQAFDLAWEVAPSTGSGQDFIIPSMCSRKRRWTAR